MDCTTSFENTLTRKCLHILACWEESLLLQDPDLTDGAVWKEPYDNLLWEPFQDFGNLTSGSLPPSGHTAGSQPWEAWKRPQVSPSVRPCSFHHPAAGSPLLRSNMALERRPPVQSSRLTHLTLCLALWSHGAPDPLTQGKVLNKGEAWEDGTVGLCPLPEVELHRTILHQDMRVEGLTSQGFLLDSEGNAHPLPILGEGKFHIISTFKVLGDKAKGR